MQHHIFSVEIAKEHGMGVATVLNHIAYMINENRSHNRNFKNGRNWYYNSIDAMLKYFPYLSLKQLRTIIDKIKSIDYVLHDRFNKLACDKTTWFSFSDEGLRKFGIPISEKTEPVNDASSKAKMTLQTAPLSICPKGQMQDNAVCNTINDLPDRMVDHLPKRANSFAQKGKPIPDKNPDINQDKRKESGKSRHPTRTRVPVDFQPSDKHFLLAAQLHVDANKEKEPFIDYYLANGKTMVNWEAAFNNWLRKAATFDKKVSKKEHPVTSVINNLKRDFPSLSKEEQQSLLNFMN